MNKKYSDNELLEAVENWRKSVREKLKKEELRRNKREINPIKNTLKSLKKEIKKQTKNSNDDWNNIWKQVVGEEIRNYTKVKRWHNGFLEIKVENPILRSELDAFFKESLIESIKELVSDNRVIRGIKFISN